MADFTSIPTQAIGSGLSCRAFTVLCIVWKYYKGYEDAFPRMKKLAEQAGIGVSTTRKAIGELKDAGWIKVEPRFDTEGNGRQTSNIYRLVISAKDAAYITCDEERLPPRQESGAPPARNLAPCISTLPPHPTQKETTSTSQAPEGAQDHCAKAEKEKKAVKKSNYEPSEKALQLRQTWQDVPGLLPNSANLMACAKVFDDLHRLDKLPWERIEKINAYALRTWAPQRFMRSPVKFRELTTKKECKTWEYLEWQLQGEEEKRIKGRPGFNETAPEPPPPREDAYKRPWDKTRKK